MSSQLGSMSSPTEKLDRKDTATSIPPIEAPVLCEFPDDSEEDYPEGGRGWIVVAGCFLQATVTLGELARSCSREVIHSHSLRQSTGLGSFSAVLQRPRFS